MSSPPLHFDYNEGINVVQASVQAIISQTMDFLKESFVRASLAMASLCGLNAGHIWSNYLTRKQLSVILKGEVFQLSNLLNPVVALPLCLKTASLHNVAEGEEGQEGITCVVVQRAESSPAHLCVRGLEGFICKQQVPPANIV